MKALTNLNLILALLVVFFLKQITLIFFITPETTTLYTITHSLSNLLNIYFNIALLLYITRVKQHPISIKAFITVIVVSIYFWITDYFPIIISDPNTISDQFITSLPGLLALIATIIISIQLIKNKSNSPSKMNMKLIGYTNLLTIILNMAFPIVLAAYIMNNENPLFISDKITSSIHLIYPIALFNFFLQEKLNANTNSI